MIAAVQIPLLKDILLILGFAVVVVLLFQRLKLPSILGFLVTGIIIGPYGLILIDALYEVELMAEIGVILLLFVIGTEFSLKQLNAIRKTVFLGGTLQVGLTILVATGVFVLLDYSVESSVFIGFLFALSSTAIVLRLLQERNAMHTPHGQIALGILIFQDVIVVPMMLVTPILAGQADNVGREVALLLGKTAIVIAITIVSARYIVPRVFHWIAQTKSKELFLLATVVLCFAVAYLTSEAGLSLALGAFLAGLIVSESEYSHQATSLIIPFREIFTSFFFVSIGMLLDLGFLIDHIGLILLAVVIVMLVKGVIVGLAALALRYPMRTVLITGFTLFQVGEFAFILSKIGITYELLSPEMYQYFLSVSILTMAITPFVLQSGEKWADGILRKTGKLPLPTTPNNQPTDQDWHDHLVIIGYGVNGRNVAQAARLAQIPYVILELNPDTVRKEKAKGENILFGDAIHDHILHQVHIDKARVVVVAISDPQATKQIISAIRQHSQTVHLIIRTRFIKETEELMRLGANEVIPEEFETSVEIFSRVLYRFLVPLDQIGSWVDDIRRDNYSMLRPGGLPKVPASAAHLPDFNISCVRVQADSGKVVNKALADSHVRQIFGVTVLAIERNEELIADIDADETIRQHDLVYVSGPQEKIQQFYEAVS